MSNFRNFNEILDEYLKDKEFAAEFLAHALEEEDFETFLTCLKDVMRVHGNNETDLKSIFNLIHNLGYELRIVKRT